ncbi:MAG: 16S rRNA (guanine(966)-N(2))-methyltransferase RsmD [Clostridiales bacterium]|nr:16S rRNA (guanine(966)-N(2))-methyltransferase RsmD [Clostridiales bacterium]
MRVIAGDFKGRRLVAPKGADVRPTADRVKEAIFSMVQPELENAVCLDMFAGTGALGIEALSRGAARVYFCDNASASLAALEKNLDICHAEGRRTVVTKGDWHIAVANITEKCNLVFIDAPYEMCEYYPQILKALAVHGVLEAGAGIVIERDAQKGGYGLPDAFVKVREKRYGGTCVDLLIYGSIGEAE